ncbi:LOW QUALITY PROTEIN: hypothetical protein ACHAWF_013622 [Thalassiosira exigua]
MLCNVTDGHLMNYKAMTDGTKIVVMKFLARLYAPMFLMLWLGINTHCYVEDDQIISFPRSVSPLAFTYYGGLLATLGNVREGYCFVKVSLEMLAQMGQNEVSGQVICMRAHILCYVEPFQATVEFFNEGYVAAMKSGDTYNAMLSKLKHTTGLFWSSRATLETVKEGFDNCRQLMKQYNQLTTWLNQVSIVETSTLALLGLEDETDQLTDFTGNPFFAMNFHFRNVYVGYLFRRYEQMMSSAKRYFSLNKMRSHFYCIPIHAKPSY